MAQGDTGDARGLPPMSSSRRRFLRQVAAGAVLMGPGGMVLRGCASGGDDDDASDGDTTDAPPTGDTAAGSTPGTSGSPDTSGQGSADPDNPFGVAPDAPLEIYIFDGGYGDKYATDVHEPMFSAKYPDAKIDHHAEVNIAQALQTRFADQDPPDFINDSGDGQIPLGQLVDQGLVLDLTPLYDAPSWDDPSVTVRDTLLPGAIDVGSFNGTPYVLNYVSTVYGLWYDKALFDEHGWEPPRTWDDMMALCEDIKGAGIAPWTYQGANAPRYMSWPLLTMAAKLAGPQVLVDIDNLKEGAWGHDAMREAAAALLSLREEGYILEGSEGMEHTAAQTQWSQGKAAIVPSGGWLESEQSEVTPEGFQFAFMHEPLLSNDAVMPYESVRITAGEPYIIPKDAENTAGALEYMRAMLSKEGARGFTEITSSVTVVDGAADGMKFLPGLASAQKAVEDAGDNAINWLYNVWYRSMENPGIDAAMGALMAGDIGVDQWVEQCEAEAKKIRDDSAITKYTREA